MSILTAKQPLIGGGVDQGLYPYEIPRGARFNGTSDRFYRTIATNNTDKWVFSTWYKNGEDIATAGNRVLFGAYEDSSNRTHILTNGSGVVVLYQLSGGVGAHSITTSTELVDASNWNHFLMQWDHDQTTDKTRCRMWVNGVEDATIITIGGSTGMNLEIGKSGVEHSIGDGVLGVFDRPFIGYMADTVWLQGMTLDDLDDGINTFGEHKYGVWVPKRIPDLSSVTPTDESFHLDYTSDATIADNAFGANQNWSEDGNIPSTKDTPTTNYMTWDPTAQSAANCTHTAACTYCASTASTYDIGLATQRLLNDAAAKGKFYYEIEWISCGTGTQRVRFGKGNTAIDYYEDGSTTGMTGSPTFATYTTGDIIGIAVDTKQEQIQFTKNGVIQGTGFYDWVDGMSQDALIYAGELTFTVRLVSGAEGFNYDPPSGFQPINSQTNRMPTYIYPAEYYGLLNWVGDAPNDVEVNGLQFDLSSEDALIITKSRDRNDYWNWNDTVRGLTKHLSSSQLDAEATATRIDSYDTDGFTVAGGSGRCNQSGDNYIGHVYRKSATAGFDIVTYTGTGVARTIAHSLGEIPEMIIVKNRSTGVTNWCIYHRVLGNTKYLSMSAAAGALSSAWNNTTPTSSVFSVGTPSMVNTLNDNYVAYLFAKKTAMTRIGSYTGTGSSSTGANVHTNFRPAVVWIKGDTTQDWCLYDVGRRIKGDMYGERLEPNTWDAADTASEFLTFHSTGFKIRSTNAQVNSSGIVYYFLALAENPFWFSNGN